MNNINDDALSYDQDFYDQDFYEQPENLTFSRSRFLPRRNMVRNIQPTPRVVLNRNVARPIIPQPNRGVINKNYNMPNLDQFDVTVKKTIVGAFPAADMPFVLFAPALLVSDYLPILKQFIPTGVTLVVEKNAESINFVYTSGATSVSLEVSSNITSYPTIVESLMVDKMNVVRVRETLGDASILAQLSESVRISNGSMFGGFSSNTISAASQKSPFQFQNGILDFDNLNIPLDKFKGFLSFITSSAPTGFENTYSFWVTNVKKQ